jgi:hypothetical protein
MTALAETSHEVVETATDGVLDPSTDRAAEVLARADRVVDDLRALDWTLFERSPPGGYALSRVLASLVRTAEHGRNVGRVALPDDLRTSVEQPDDPEDVYGLAVELREVATTAQGVVQTADDLSVDLEAFESWLDSPARRYDEFGEDIDLVDESLAELTAAAAALPSESDAPAVDWADATMRTRV